MLAWHTNLHQAPVAGTFAVTEMPFSPATLSEAERATIQPSAETREADTGGKLHWLDLLKFRQTWGVVVAKFFSDAAWYFYIFWLPKFLMETFQIKFSAASSIGWIPYAASGVGCLVGGGFSSWLLKRGVSVNAFAGKGSAARTPTSS